MPALELKTNVKAEDPRALVAELSQLCADVFKFPLHLICVSYEYNEYLAWAGTFEPALWINVSTLENLGVEENDRYSKALFAFVGEKLGIEDSRGFIMFNDPGRENIGYRSTTVRMVKGPK
ncbi:hypothetical protein EW026_g6603 [Hermanssonia centrifuga]|uniref:L-dopachrome isomerase n=1 Tax=Hermanssonia centrifuga TaxID=98765 RepID=A0A4S4KC89_9APHY|nr:hypothetical protein EW026_g6603 [Hermanssonia centrifuga]